MAKMPEGVSMQASLIQSALSEGRDEHARQMIVAILLAGKADKVTQRIAAEMLTPKVRKRGRPKSLPMHWHDIAMEFHHLRGNGVGHEKALEEIAKQFFCSETHVRNSVDLYDEAKEASDEASRDYYDRN